MKTTSNYKNPFASFWGLLRQTENYDDNFKEEIKRAWVREYSGGQTESLAGFRRDQPTAFNRMIKAMRSEAQNKKTREDARRKYLLALIYEFCKHKGYECTKEKALFIACKACGVAKLNEATDQQIIAATKRFKRLEGQAWAAAVLDNILTDMNN